MKIGIVAPPWVPVPPVAYGGTELMIDTLARGLAELGHELVLCTTGDSTCPVPKWSLWETTNGMRIGTTSVEMRHVLGSYEELGDDLDIIHDHTLFGPLYADPSKTPIVTTNHGPFAWDLVEIWSTVANRGVKIISISEHQASTADVSIPVAEVIHHGIDISKFTVGEGAGGYLACLTRMAPEKGVHTAVEAAREAGMPLRIAAKMRETAEREYFEAKVKPYLSNEIEYLGELETADKLALVGEAVALMNPIAWPEPFGLAMTESLACGTPVIATPCGSVPEIITQGRTGFIVETIEDLVEAAHKASTLDRRACRDEVEERFSMRAMAENHVTFFEKVIAEHAEGRSAAMVMETATTNVNATTIVQDEISVSID